MLAWPVLAGLCLLATVIYMMVNYGDGEAVAPDADHAAHSHSTSALGHAALVAYLQRGGWEVNVSTRLGDQLNLIIAPRLRNSTDWRRLLAALPQDEMATPTVVVLPKWEAGAAKGAWLQSVELRTLKQEQELLDVLSLVAQGRRDEVMGALEAETLAGLPLRGLTVTRATAQPEDPIEVRHHAQWIYIGETTYAPPLAPEVLLGDASRAALVKLHNALYVAADPDWFNNHGLVHERNRDALTAAFKAFPGLTIVETVHGFGGGATLGRRALTYPNSLITGSGLLLVLLLVVMAARRFGPVRVESPRVAMGNLGLIANTAALLQASGHADAVLAAFREAQLRAVARRLNAPPHLSTEALVAWLDAWALRRGRPGQVAALMAPLELPRKRDAHVARAQAMYAWKQEMMRGTAAKHS